MNQKSFFSILTVVILVLTGLSGCNVGSNALIGSQKTPTAAIFVPKLAPIMVSMLVNPDRLEDLAQIVASPKDRRKTKEELSQLKTSVLANTGVDYEQDIKPWVGDEITVAVTSVDRDRDPSNGQQPGYLIAVETKDAAKSRDFVELLFARKAIAGANLVIEEYNGIRLLSNTPRLQPENILTKAEGGLSGAVVGDNFVLFANHAQVLKEAINNVQAPDLNLTTSSQYQQALTQLPARKVGLAFLNYPSLVGGKVESPPTYESQIVAFELNPQGLLAETTVVAGLDQEILPPISTLSQPAKALRYIPSTVSLAISGVDLSKLPDSNLQQFWAQVSPGLSITKLVEKPIAELQANWGINLLDDVFSWVEGEYALGKLPNNDWIFAVERSDRAIEGIEKLNAIASTKELSITSLPLANQKVSAWTQLTPVAKQEKNSSDPSITLNAKVQGVHTTVDNYEIFATSISAMEQVLKINKNGSLADDSQFLASTNAIPQPNEGYVYVDWQANQAIVKRQLPIISLLEVAGKPFFSNLRSLTISSYDNKEDLLTGGIFFKFNAK